MYLKKLEIFGFKSFADKTSLEFGPGITAVIGPNGCGKSNVFDAIRWVLGEQSAKELRANSMEDVIFNGTDKKTALGFAEVGLTFSNESHLLPIEYDEVTVTRRLFRSGESEYLLNKNTARLKDIVELFMGTGVGAEAYSLVQQGKVDLVVSAKPEDRRMILDEASGITKYKAKKREALNKLKDTEDNLLRINDIIVEVKRQISSLERQANKAKKYKVEFEKLKDLEVRLANHRLGQFKDERQQLHRCLSELRAREEQLSGELNEHNNLLDSVTLLLEELEDKITELKAEDIKRDGQIDINHRQIEFDEERIQNIIDNARRLAEQKELIIQKCRAQQVKLEEAKLALGTLDGQMQRSLDLLRTKRSNLQVITDQIQGAQQMIKQDEEKILDVTSQQVRVKNRLTESMKEIQGCLARKRRLEIEQVKVTSEKEEVEQRLCDIHDKYTRVSGTIQNLAQELATRRANLDELLAAMAALEQTIDELEKKKLFLRSQKEFIEKLSIQYDDMPDPIVEGRFITQTPPRDEYRGIIGKVKDIIPLEPGQPLPWGQEPGDPGRVYYDLVCEAKFIQLDPQQIDARIEDLNRQIGEQIVLKQDLLAKVEEQKHAVNDMSQEIQAEEKSLSIFEAQKNDIATESNKLNEELELVQIELNEVADALLLVKRTEDDLGLELDVLNQDVGLAQSHIKDLQDSISQKALEREETTVLIAQLETEIKSLEDKKTSFNDNIKMFMDAIDNYLEEIKKTEDEYHELQGKREHYEQDIESLREVIGELKKQKEALIQELAGYDRQKEEVAQRIGSIRHQIAACVNDIEEVRSQIHQQQMLDQEITFKEKEIRDRLAQSYKIDLEPYNEEQRLRAAAEAERGELPLAPEEIFDAEATQIAIEQIRKRCDSFGSVNLVAIEEFEELRERFEFLTKQQSDLITSKESLHQTINKINRQTRQMFMNTFTKVSEEFRIYFRMLFGGGEAQLILIDPENVLESGIEIIARPPGKKLQHISLLSGGEKTLTAIALIFGVFKVNPSPFCILDEIDAALDESNVGRYSYLLKDFSKIAQFIIITHNKKTIESANVLYGVTMEETGVSKVVSVKFNDKDKGVEQIPADVPATVS